MRVIFCIFLCLILASCASQKEYTAPERFSIDLSFYPSFHLPINLKIVRVDDTGYLVSHVLSRDSATSTISNDSVPLTKNDFDIFFKQLGNTSLLTIQSDTPRLGVDGITVEAKIVEGEKTNKFGFWSPSRKEYPIYYKFLDAVFDLANRKLAKQEDYVEDIQNYFEYGLGVKVKGANPTIIKMYGSYSIDDEGALEKFFKGLPSNKPIIMDMSNFGGMGTILHDYFSDCDASHKKMVWITPGSYRQYFINVGIDSSKMAPDIETAKKMIQSR